MHRRLIPAVLSAAFTALLFAQNAQADVIINFTELPGAVRADWSGTLNLSGIPLSPALTSSQGGMASGSGVFLGYSPASSVIRLSDPLVIVPSMQAFGTDTVYTFATGFSGTAFGFDSVGRFGIESTYVSNAPLAGSLTFGGESYTSLGLSPTVTPYEWTLTNGDQFFVSINSSAAVPEPSAFLLLLVGACSAVFVRHRRRTRTAGAADA